jgi:hypothetical protein
MHLLLAPGVRGEQTRWRPAKLCSEELLDRVALAQAGRTRVWFPTAYRVEVAHQWLRGDRPGGHGLHLAYLTKHIQRSSQYSTHEVAGSEYSNSRCTVSRSAGHRISVRADRPRRQLHTFSGEERHRGVSEALFRCGGERPRRSPAGWVRSPRPSRGTYAFYVAPNGQTRQGLWWRRDVCGV